MKILLVADLNKGNRFVDDLYDILKRKHNVIASESEFWDRDSSYDVIYFQWPEALMGWEHYTDEKAQRAFEYLSLRKKDSKLIVIRHNLYPHYKRSREYELWYDAFYTYMDAVIHMGRSSLEDYIDRYPNIYDSQLHWIIPHPWYATLPNTANKLESRQFLNISAEREVITIFGVLRQSEEQALAKKSFDNLTLGCKTLVASQWIEQSIPSWRINPYKRALNIIENYYQNKSKKYRLGGGRVPEDQIQYYLNASDIIFIPRLNTLNSGNVPLAFTFSKVVVGPDIGNIGEILHQSGNPVFDPDDYMSATRALMEGIKMSKQGKGLENYQYAKNNWNLEITGKSYSEFFKELMSVE